MPCLRAHQQCPGGQDCMQSVRLEHEYIQAQVTALLLMEPQSPIKRWDFLQVIVNMNHTCVYVCTHHSNWCIWGWHVIAGILCDIACIFWLRHPSTDPHGTQQPSAVSTDEPHTDNRDILTKVHYIWWKWAEYNYKYVTRIWYMLCRCTVGVQVVDIISMWNSSFFPPNPLFIS